MRADVGDWLVVEGTHLDDHRRRGQILEVHPRKIQVRS
jgi:uncharacterized protein DUF1918